MLPRGRIDIEESQNRRIIELSEMFKKYGLELYVYDITTDIPIPTILSIVIDRSGEGPAVIADAATDLDPEDAVITSIEAAQQARPWLRNEMFHLSDTRAQDLERAHPEYWVSTNLHRGLFWGDTSRISELDFLLKCEKKTKVESINNLSSRDSERNLRTILQMFQDKQMEVAYIDITTPDIEELGMKVVRVIIPELQPLHGDERFKYLGGRRLYEVPKALGYRTTDTAVNELNQIPHPFV
jgi:ribosomal protein S12 methylthiotransferase accessory factor